MTSDQAHSMMSGPEERKRLQGDLPPWYWPNISREEAEKKLAGLPNGSFLMRDCSVQAGDFTLIVRHTGHGRCVRVYQQDGRYGLSSGDNPFNSLEDLVQFYRTHSLASFNKRLDVCLKGAVCRQASEHEEVRQYAVFRELYDLSQEQLKAQTRLSVLQHQHDELEKNVAMCRMMIPALDVVRQLYYDQLRLQANVDSNAVDIKDLVAGGGTIQQVAGTLHGVPDTTDQYDDREGEEEEDPEKQCVRSLSQEEERSLAINTRLLVKRHSGLTTKIQNMQAHLESNSAELQDLMKEMNALEVCLLDMERRHDDLTRQMIMMGTDREYLTQILEPRVATAEFDRSMWLVHCNREEAEDQLQGLPHGAFLVRHKDKKRFPFVLSIVVVPETGGHSTIQHCYIVRPKGRGFGFNAAMAIFQSIDQLVLRHRYISLKHYFRDIDASLAFPVGCQEMLSRRSDSVLSWDIGLSDFSSVNKGDESMLSQTGDSTDVSSQKVPVNGNILAEKLDDNSADSNQNSFFNFPSNSGHTGLLSQSAAQMRSRLGEQTCTDNLPTITVTPAYGVPLRDVASLPFAEKSSRSDAEEVIYINTSELHKHHDPTITVEDSLNSEKNAAEKMPSVTEKHDVNEMEQSDDSDASDHPYEDILDLTVNLKQKAANATSNANQAPPLPDRNTKATATDVNASKETVSKDKDAAVSRDSLNEILKMDTLASESMISDSVPVNTNSITSANVECTSEGVSTAVTDNEHFPETLKDTDFPPTVAAIEQNERENQNVPQKDSEVVKSDTSGSLMAGNEKSLWHQNLDEMDTGDHRKEKMLTLKLAQAEQRTLGSKLARAGQHGPVVNPESLSQLGQDTLVSNPESDRHGPAKTPESFIHETDVQGCEKSNPVDNKKGDRCFAKSEQADGISDASLANLPPAGEDESSDTDSEDSYPKLHVSELVSYFERITESKPKEPNFDAQVVKGKVQVKGRTIDVASLGRESPSEEKEKGCVRAQSLDLRRGQNLTLLCSHPPPCSCAEGGVSIGGLNFGVHEAGNTNVQPLSPTVSSTQSSRGDSGCKGVDADTGLSKVMSGSETECLSTASFEKTHTEGPSNADKFCDAHLSTHTQKLSTSLTDAENTDKHAQKLGTSLTGAEKADKCKTSEPHTVCDNGMTYRCEQDLQQSSILPPCAGEAAVANKNDSLTTVSSVLEKDTCSGTSREIASAPGKENGAAKPSSSDGKEMHTHRSGENLAEVNSGNKISVSKIHGTEVSDSGIHESGLAHGPTLSHGSDKLGESSKAKPQESEGGRLKETITDYLSARSSEELRSGVVVEESEAERGQTEDASKHEINPVMLTPPSAQLRGGQCEHKRVDTHSVTSKDAEKKHDNFIQSPLETELQNSKRSENHSEKEKTGLDQNCVLSADHTESEIGNKTQAQSLENTDILCQGNRQPTVEYRTQISTNLLAANKNDAVLIRAMRSKSCSDADLLPETLTTETVAKDLGAAAAVEVDTMKPVFVTLQQEDEDYVDV